MSDSIYTDTPSDNSNIYATQNNITVALALGGKRLTKLYMLIRQMICI